MGAQKIEWTDELRERIAHLYRVDGLSASQVAEAMGPEFNRNMILGALRRIGKLRSGDHSKGTLKKVEVPKPVKKYEYKPPVKPGPVDTVWDMPENERRRIFALRAARAARKILGTMTNA